MGVTGWVGVAMNATINFDRIGHGVRGGSPPHRIISFSLEGRNAYTAAKALAPLKDWNIQDRKVRPQTAGLRADHRHPLPWERPGG